MLSVDTCRTCGLLNHFKYDWSDIYFEVIPTYSLVVDYIETKTDAERTTVHKIYLYFLKAFI